MQLLTFSTVGLGNAAIDALVFALLVRAWGAEEGVWPVFASMLGFVAGASHSYAWNSRVTFRERPTSMLTAVRFAAVVLTGALLSGATFAVASAVWPDAGTRLAGGKLVAIGVSAAANFTLMRAWAFRTRPASLGRAAAWRWAPLATVLGVALAARLPLLGAPGYRWDIGLFRQWAATGVEGGLAAAIRRPDMDYVGYNYVLTALGRGYRAVMGPVDLATSEGFAVALKLVPLAGDLAVCALLYAFGRRWGERLPGARWTERLPWLDRLGRGERVGVAAALLYALNPAVLYDSAYWGQVDSLVAASMLGAVLLVLGRHSGWAGVVIALGFLVKPHPVLLAPLLVWLALLYEGPLGPPRGLAAAAVVVAAGLAPFWAVGVWPEVRQIYDHLFEVGEQVSVSAWNVWWLAYRADPGVRPGDLLLTAGPLHLSIERASQGLLALAAAVAFASLLPRPTPGRALLAAAFLVLAFFMLTMKMHERYLFPLFALLAPAAVLSRGWLAMYALLSVTFVLNLYDVYPAPPPPDLGSGRHYVGAPGDVTVSVVNAALTVVFAGALVASSLRAWLACRGAPRAGERAEGTAGRSS